MYALTALLYQCLTGEIPYPSDADAGVMHAHLHEPPPTLPPLGPATATLERVIARGMAKNPAERYRRDRDDARRFGGHRGASGEQATVCAGVSARVQRRGSRPGRFFGAGSGRRATHPRAGRRAGPRTGWLSSDRDGTPAAARSS